MLNQKITIQLISAAILQSLQPFSAISIAPYKLTTSCINLYTTVACNSTFLLLVKVFITFCILSSPGYELYVICADSQPKSVGLV